MSCVLARRCSAVWGAVCIVHSWEEGAGRPAQVPSAAREAGAGSDRQGRDSGLGVGLRRGSLKSSHLCAVPSPCVSTWTGFWGRYASTRSGESRPSSLRPPGLWGPGRGSSDPGALQGTLAMFSPSRPRVGAGEA